MKRFDVHADRPVAAWLSLILALASGACSSNQPVSADPDDSGGHDTAPAALRTDLGTSQGAQPLGAAFVVDLTIDNSGPKSVGVDLMFELTSPTGASVEFYETSVFAPFEGAVTESVVVTPAQWFEDLGAYVVTVRSAGESLGSTSLVVTEPSTIVPIFEDATEVAGVSTSVPEADCGQFTNGAAWSDVDLDGFLDLLITRLGEPARLFMNDGAGGFTEDSERRGLAVSDVNGASFADYDNDGDPDVLLTRDGSDSLLRNDGSGHFADVSEEAGIGDPGWRGVTAAWGDYDNDGHLDVYVVNYMECLGEWATVGDIINEVEYHPDILYRNNGDGSFSDVTVLVENDPDDYYDGYTLGAGFGAAWIDYNDDGRPDLYLANDFVGPVPDHNRLWRNDGDGPDGWQFTDVSVDSGTGLFMNTMGIGIGDVDRDLDLDIALSNVGANKLLRNEAGDRFTEETDVGIARPSPQVGFESITWGVAFYDLNLDAWEDLYLAAGNFLEGVADRVVEQPNEVFISAGTGDLFLDVSAATGADDPGDSKGVAFADYDRDGDIDLFVVNQGGQPHLFENVTPRAGHHWLQVELVGTDSNRDACGARVNVDTGREVLTRAISCGSTSVASTSQLAAHFGLGALDGAVDIEVLWPSGRRQDLVAVEVDQFVEIVESTP